MWYTFLGRYDGGYILWGAETGRESTQLLGEVNLISWLQILFFPASWRTGPVGMYLCKQELADMPHHEILLYPSSRLIGPVTVAPSSKPQFLYVTIEKRTWGLSHTDLSSVLILPLWIWVVYLTFLNLSLFISEMRIISTLHGKIITIINTIVSIYWVPTKCQELAQCFRFVI